MSHPLSDLIESIVSVERREPPPSRIPRVGQIASLREFLEDYRGEIPFKVGDLVTPRRTSCTTGAGEPCLVIEVVPDATFCFQGTMGSNEFGKKLDIRVARMTAEGRIALFWLEHSEVELFVEAQASSAPQPEEVAA